MPGIWYKATSSPRSRPGVTGRFPSGFLGVSLHRVWLHLPSHFVLSSILYFPTIAFFSTIFSSNVLTTPVINFDLLLPIIPLPESYLQLVLTLYIYLFIIIFIFYTYYYTQYILPPQVQYASCHERSDIRRLKRKEKFSTLCSLSCKFVHRQTSTLQGFHIAETTHNCHLIKVRGSIPGLFPKPSPIQTSFKLFF